MRFFYYFFIIGFLLTTTSCRRDKEFVIKKKKLISHEKINSIKNMERRLLIWRNKKDFNTLDKYLIAKENYIKFSNNVIEDRLFLAEYYFYLSFLTKQKGKKTEALKKAYYNSREGLKLSSPKYKKKLDENYQDYQIINLVNSLNPSLLYWYINNLIFLRKEQENIVLFKDDIEACIKYFHKISNVKEKIFSEVIFLYSMPKIANGDKKIAISYLEKLDEYNILNSFIKELYISKDSNKSYQKLISKLIKNDFKEEVLLKMIEKNFKTKK